LLSIAYGLCFIEFNWIRESKLNLNKSILKDCII
jgi:hypothetical protein